MHTSDRNSPIHSTSIIFKSHQQLMLADTWAYLTIKNIKVLFFENFYSFGNQCFGKENFKFHFEIKFQKFSEFEKLQKVIV